MCAQSGQDSSQFLMKKSQKNATYDWGKGEAPLTYYKLYGW